MGGGMGPRMSEDNGGGGDDGGGMGSPSPSSRGQALRGNNGRDGSPHARGQREGGGMGSVEEASSAVGFVEGNRRRYCQTASRMPMTA